MFRKRNSEIFKAVKIKPVSGVYMHSALYVNPSKFAKKFTTETWHSQPPLLDGNKVLTKKLFQKSQGTDLHLKGFLKPHWYAQSLLPPPHITLSHAFTIQNYIFNIVQRMRETLPFNVRKWGEFQKQRPFNRDKLSLWPSQPFTLPKLPQLLIISLQTAGENPRHLWCTWFAPCKTNESP